MRSDGYTGLSEIRPDRQRSMASTSLSSMTEFDPLLSVVRWRSGRSRTSLNGYERSLAARLLNQVVSPRQHRWWNGEAEVFGRFQIDHQLELGGLLNGHVAGLGGLENPVDVGSGAPMQISQVRAIGHKPPSIAIFPRRTRCRQPVLCRQVHEALSVNAKHCDW